MKYRLLILLVMVLSGCRSVPLPEAEHIREIQPVRPAPVKVPVEADLVWDRKAEGF